MSARPKTPVPPSAYLLADHLDATLAAGEDLLAAGRRCRALIDSMPSPRAPQAGHAVALRTSVELVRSLELALITRATKAREWSQMLVKLDPRFRQIGSLFIAGTAPLIDAIAEFADATEQDFETGDVMTAYFRGRGILLPGMSALHEIDGPFVTEGFLVSRRIELGPLLDLAAAYLDALEIHFTLFDAADEAAHLQTAEPGTAGAPV
ncbi:MAG: hypothetical protein K2Y05_06740 [Hyphomicrobiaceae bacterium]|nr:hypothetical protein [Hyphomicrobiaceae bacterium]